MRLGHRDRHLPQASSKNSVRIATLTTHAVSLKDQQRQHFLALSLEQQPKKDQVPDEDALVGKLDRNLKEKESA